MNGQSFTAWYMVEPGKRIEMRSASAPVVTAGEALVEVSGCGVCHTDISFHSLGVKTRADLPLVLGHEISGIVREVGEGLSPGLVGKPVLVPAVLPCGKCDLCQAGFRTICRSQIMPGNDRHGGFASHVLVPALYLCPVGQDVLSNHELWELSIVSDAVTTPYMAIKRSSLAKDELAVVIGVGGIGIHCVQIAASRGAKVIALDIDQRKLDMALSSGAKAAFNVSGLSIKEIKRMVGGEAKNLGAPQALWKIFETSGTKAGQDTAYGLLTFGAYVAIIGFTMERLEVRLSNLMAFDATLRGNWGCDPVLYPEVLQELAAGRIQLKPFVERHPLSSINEVFEEAHRGQLLKRAVLVP